MGGNKVEQNRSTVGKMELHKAIRNIVETDGQEIVKDVRLVNILSDFRAFDAIPASKYILRAVIADGYSHKLLAIGAWNSQSENLCNKFVATTGFQNDYAYMVFQSLAYGLGWKKTVEQHNVTSNSENILHSQSIEFQSSNNSKDQIITIDGVDFVMTFVEKGQFVYGAQSENRYHPNYDPEAEYRERVSSRNVQSFYIGKFLVTQKQWQVVMGDNPAFNNKGGNYPIESVSWSEIDEFVERLKQKTHYHFRLPTQTEWEYAARGGKHSQGFKYPGSNVLKVVAWTGLEGQETHEVGKKQPNELGIYDMLGNVSELCDGHFLRGGSSKPVIDWYAYRLGNKRSLGTINLCRISAWTEAFLIKGDPYVGFRLAME